MTEKRIFTSLGLMSGTSADGIDAAVLLSDGTRILEFGPSAAFSYDGPFRERLQGVLGGGGDCAGVGRELTLRHARAVQSLLEKNGLAAAGIDLIGFHGHTVLHEPGEGRTLQIGDGARLAKETGIDVVDDFRSADMRAGGEGAPLAPLYHLALSRDLARPLAVLNLGGVANVTWIGDGGEADVAAFDTGPGNALLDDWAQARTGLPMDRDGELARAGRVDRGVLAALMADPYFARPPPKSMDRNLFRSDAVEGLSDADGAATLTAFTAAAIGRAGAFLPTAPRRWLVTGGGRLNPSLMAVLGETLGVPVEPVETVGWDGDMLEAQAFAYLAVRSRLGLALSLPATTGVREPQSGGVLHKAPNNTA